jgi:hypothetical protein
MHDCHHFLLQLLGRRGEKFSFSQHVLCVFPWHGQLSVILWECLGQTHRGLLTPELQQPLGTPIVLPQGACDPTTRCSGRGTAACCGLEAQSKDGGSFAPAAERGRSASNL